MTATVLSTQYVNAIARLDSLTNHEKRAQSARSWGLERVVQVAGQLGNPFTQYETIHVTGTKGKGTTSTLMARLLQATGRQVGLYTSPHVRDVRERIKLNGVPISEAAFVKAFNTVWELTGRVDDGVERPVSYFEMLTHTAFVAFAQAKVDIAVIEVGMGGTLDATNILKTPRACVLTPVSLDHTKILGSTVEAIAADKSGIIKPGAHVIIADQQPLAAAVIRERARMEKCTRVWQLGRDVQYSWGPSAFTGSTGATATGGAAALNGLADLGGWEVEVCTPVSTVRLPLSVPAQMAAGNVAAAWSALASLGLAPTEAVARAALKSFHLEGRFERLHVRGMDWIFDGAHNVASTEYLVEAISNAFPGREITLAFGCMSDKDGAQMMRLWQPVVKRVVCTQSGSQRANSVAEMAALARAAGVTDVCEGPALEALPEFLAARAAGDTAPLLVVTGSFYLVGDLLALLA